MRELQHFTGIGSRQTPAYVCEVMKKITPICNNSGFILRSGGADGADSAFEADAVYKEIYLPWERFNNNNSTLFGVCHGAIDIAKKIHPRWDSLSSGAKKLHARNIYQVLGKSLDTPSKFVIAYTEGGELIGGTRTALVLATQYNIPIFNFGSYSNFLTCEEEMMDAVKLFLRDFI